MTAAFDERLSFRLLRPFEYLPVPFFAPVTDSPSYSSPCAFYFRTADDNRTHLRRFIVVFLKIQIVPRDRNNLRYFLDYYFDHLQETIKKIFYMTLKIVLLAVVLGKT